MPRRVLLILAAGLILLGLLAVGCNTYLRYQGWATERVTPEALSDLLRPSYAVYMPDGDGPFPTVLLFSGCDGPKDNMHRWAAALNASGWGALIVDSHAPRGYDDAQLWRLICAGQVLTGGARAGDVAVAIEDARALPSVDASRIVLMGASHGGWSILDMLALHATERAPYSLTQWPQGIAETGFSGVAGMILLYPYCGVGSQVARHGWEARIPALFLLVEDDTIADEDRCEDLAARMSSSGHDVRTRQFEGTTHGFDQSQKNALSTLEFSPTTIAAAEAEVQAFLARVAPQR